MDRIVLDLGSDSTYCEDYITLDLVHLKGKNFVECDLTKGIPFEDNSVEAIVSNHFIEHILLKDCLLTEFVCDIIYNKFAFVNS